MNIVIFDTETTSLEKPFCYNIGYIIADTETRETLLKREFVIEQVWHNLPLFESAYYKDKRPFYVSEMKAKKIIMNKFGYVCQQMVRDFKAFEIAFAFAYNSPFDEKVFNFNCDWFKCKNPFDNIEIKDIRGFAHHSICFNDTYKNFCDTNKFYSDSGNYSTTAEVVYRFVSRDRDFIESHTALSDSEIEKEILFACLDLGLGIENDYKPFKSLEKVFERPLEIVKNGETIFETTYNKITIRNNKQKIILR